MNREIERIDDVVINEKSLPVYLHHKVSRQSKGGDHRPAKRVNSSTLEKGDDSLVKVPVLFSAPT